MNKKFAAIGLTAGLAAGTGAGLILQGSGNVGASPVAATATTEPSQPSQPSPSTPVANDATDAADTTPDQWVTDALAPLVKDGTLTQAQADKVATALDAARPQGGPGGHDGMGRHAGGPGLAAVATALGMTEADVRTALESGQTLAQLAESKGKTAQTVIDALVADATTRISQAVTDGKLAQAEADTRLKDLTTRITEAVNNGAPFGGGRGDHGPGGFGGAHAPGGNDADSDDATVPAGTDTTVPQA